HAPEEQNRDPPPSREAALRPRQVPAQRVRDPRRRGRGHRELHVLTGTLKSRRKVYPEPDPRREASMTEKDQQFTRMWNEANKSKQEKFRHLMKSKLATRPVIYNEGNAP